MAVTTYHTAVCVAVKKGKKKDLCQLKAMGSPQLELSRQLSINDRSNNRNSWTASVTQINRIGFIVELAGWFDI